MHTISTSGIPADQIAKLEEFAAHHAGPELQDVLRSLGPWFREGGEISVDSPHSTLTPSQVASRLGMSRSHLYKLLDSGEIVSHRVGRDRRIQARDVVEFEARRERDRRELAERFAHQQETRHGAIDEIADLL